MRYRRFKVLKERRKKTTSTSSRPPSVVAQPKPVSAPSVDVGEMTFGYEEEF